MAGFRALNALESACVRIRGVEREGLRGSGVEESPAVRQIEYAEGIAGEMSKR
jgi:hypothetical protein